MKKLLMIIFIPVVAFYSCSVSRNYDPNKKFSPEELKNDYSLLRNILEEKHPSLYWYTPKDSMDMYFNRGLDLISDSMTELNFGWKVIAPLLEKIHCGHTSFGMSKAWYHFIKDRNIPSFPLFMKVWKDSMMVVANLNKGSTVKPGDFITSINGVSTQKIIDSLFQYMPEDGYSDNINYIRLSAAFPMYYRNVFGIYKSYQVTVADSLGNTTSAVIKWWAPKVDSTLKKKMPTAKKHHLSAKAKRDRIRSVTFNATTAIMPVNAFSKGHLNSFFRRNFRIIRKDKIQNLVIDLRVNGGGDMNKAVSLARYISKNEFHVADSAYSISKNFNPWSNHISKSFENNLALIFATKKRRDGKYHFGYWEHHVFKPRKRNHFDGKVYILTNGLTFSAASLFCNFVKGQDNVLLVGEETGGGWYGNSGILIPNITLPKTKLRVRLPFFRLVQYHHQEAVKGSGIIPDWHIGPNARDILNDRDTKMEAVLKRIKNSEEPAGDFNF